MNLVVLNLDDTSDTRQANLNADQCHWCGGRFGVHGEECRVPRLLRQLKERKRLLAYPYDNGQRSSLQAFNEAQSNGTTVGHEWARQHDERSNVAG